MRETNKRNLRRWPLRFVVLATLAALARPAEAQSSTPNPETVAIAGTPQSELGCPGDWRPSCEKTFLTYDAASDVWRGAFNVPPGDDQDQKGPRRKAALNGSWSENYGAKAQAGGGDTAVKQARYDGSTGVFTAPGRTTAVFVVKGAPGAPASPTPTAGTKIYAPNVSSSASPSGGTAQPFGALTFGWLVLGVLAILALIGAIQHERQKKGGDDDE